MREIGIMQKANATKHRGRCQSSTYADSTDSGFRNHPDIALVGAHYDDLKSKLWQTATRSPNLIGKIKTFMSNSFRNNEFNYDGLQSSAGIPSAEASLVTSVTISEGRRSFAFWGDRMIQRTIASTVVACVLFCLASGFADAQISSRKSSVNQSDSVLFEQAKKALGRADFAEARSLLNTLIDTHPDSDYVPRAKLSIADSWYSQRAFKQAEAEYRDFVTFFPNRPEIAEVQRRLSSIRKDTSF